MKEFISSNGLLMIEGISFNWKKIFTYYNNTGPVFHSISFGGLGDMWQANYSIDTNIVTITNMAYSANESLEFYVDTLEQAEFIVLACIKAKGLIIAPLYEKDI